MSALHNNGLNLARRAWRRTAFAVFAMVTAATVFAGSRVNAAPAALNVSFDIPAQSMATALLRFSEQTGLQVTAQGETLQVLNTAGVRGEYLAAEALGILLKGSGLTYKFVDKETIVVRGVEERVSSLEEEKDGASEGVRVVQAAGASPSVQGEGQGEPQKGASGTSASSEAEKWKVQEIIVTATKRQENVQDVPMSIAVIGNQDIERRGLIGMEDYLRAIPGVNETDFGALQNAVVVRGISTSPVFESGGAGTGSGPTVARYFDETPFTAARYIDVRPVDIERIEVLRGPQGTAYGSASLGGALRIVPVKPKLDGFSTNVAASYSETSRFGSGNSMIQGVLNIPVVEDKLGVRAVVYRYDESGFYRNVAGNDPVAIAFAQNLGFGNLLQGHVEDDVGRMRSTGGRLAALWRPTEKLNLSFNFLTQKVEQDGIPLDSIDAAGTPLIAGDYVQTQYPIAPQGRVRGEAGEVADADLDLSNLVLNYDLGWADLTSAVSWIDSFSVNPNTIAFRTLPSSATARADFKSFTTETRVASKFSGRFQLLGGVFYEKMEDDWVYNLYWLGTPQTNPSATNPRAHAVESRERNQKAVFGEFAYKLTEKLTATVGGRYFKYEDDSQVLGEGGAVPIGSGIPQIFSGSNNDASFKANLSYKPTKDSLLYASWAEGFRLGRPTAGLPSSVCDNNGDGVIDGTSVPIAATRNIDSDFLENYEVGAKFTLFDRRLAVETAVYHITWNGLPIRTVAGGTCNATFVTNAGEATSDGVEFQGSLFVVDGLRLDFGAGYTKAQLSKDAPALGALEGARLPGSPKVNANLAAQYDFDIAGRKAFVRADSFYTGEFYGNLPGTPAFKAGEYIKVDARAGIAIKSLTLEIFARNLTNEDAFAWRSAFFSGRLRPRTIGVQLGYSFE